MAWNKRWVLLLMGGFVVGAAAAQTAVALSAQDVLEQAVKPVYHGAKTRHVDPRLIHRYRVRTWKWQRLTGMPRTRAARAGSTVRHLRFWVRAATRARARAQHPPHKAAWLCIHRYEASWRDSGDPYWGGLQMDRGFMQRHAPGYLLRRGYADRWSALEQMWVAERAYRSGLGFSPWPSTARLCGVR